MHIYGVGRHPATPCLTAVTRPAVLTDRNDTPYGTSQFRFIDWFRDLGFLQKPGVQTKAAKDIAAFTAQPAH